MVEQNQQIATNAESAMITLVIQDLRSNNKLFEVQCASDCSVEDLKCMINIESQVDVAQQELFYMQVMLTNDAQQISAIGITDNDMINMGVSPLNTEE